jgi:hypothetical protein
VKFDGILVLYLKLLSVIRPRKDIITEDDYKFTRHVKPVKKTNEKTITSAQYLKRRFLHSNCANNFRGTISHSTILIVGEHSQFQHTEGLRHRPGVMRCKWSNCWTCVYRISSSSPLKNEVTSKNEGTDNVCNCDHRCLPSKAMGITYPADVKLLVPV